METIGPVNGKTQRLGGAASYHVDDQDLGGNGVIRGFLFVFIGSTRVRHAQNQDEHGHEKCAEGPSFRHDLEGCQNTIGASEEIQQSPWLRRCLEQVRTVRELYCNPQAAGRKQGSLSSLPIVPGAPACFPIRKEQAISYLHRELQARTIVIRSGQASSGICNGWPCGGNLDLVNPDKQNPMTHRCARTRSHRTQIPSNRNSITSVHRATGRYSCTC